MRAGLRAALSRASAPGTPRSRAAGPPRSAATGRAATGPSATIATTVARAPAAAIAICSVTAPNTTVPTATAANTPPTIIRVSDGRDASAATSRSAASGGTRDARSAGPSAATRVTSSPTGTAMRIEVPATVSPSIAIPIRNRVNSCRSRAAKPSPPASPARVAAAPTTRASKPTIATTCRRPAPRARSSADSRVRCAIVIANVLWIENAATSSATPPNAASTTRNTRRKPLSTRLMPSSTCALFVTASTPAGRTGAMREASSAWLTPSSARTATPLMRPVPLAMCSRAPASENAVNDVSPKASSSPNLLIPTTVTGIFCGVSTAVRSPTARSPSSANILLMTTSSGARGARPDTRWYGLSSGSVTQLPAIRGPRDWIVVPSLASSCPDPSMVGSAPATPSTWRTVPRTDPSIWPRAPHGALLTLVAFRTVTSVLPYALEKYPSMLAASVSPRTSVPVRNVTPRNTATREPAIRRLRPHSSLKTSPIMTGLPALACGPAPGRVWGRP
ncbi:Uncharacterised protein [Mycobacterium tuberculosis]|nr:Uncharacterised protein [Mycobacterium tuberculosis]